MPNSSLDFDQLFPNRFLKAGEFQGKEVTLTLAHVDLEDLPDAKGTKTKALLSFKETKKQLVLNRTNGECIKAMFGRAVGDWIGKRVCFYPATVDAFGEPTLAIRVRGSPDITNDIEAKCHIGRKDVRVTMKKTQTKGAKAPEAAPAEEPAPGEDGQP